MGKFHEVGEGSSKPKDPSHKFSKVPSNGKGKEPSHSISRVSSSGEKIDLVHLEDVQVEKKKKTRWQKFQHHMKRFWFCYILALIILLAIALPVLFLKIVPALAQLLIDKTSLPISQATLKAISNDQVIIGLTTSLSVPGGITVTLDPIDLYLYNKETPEFSPYTAVHLDSTKVRGNTEITVKDKAVNVGNRTELNKWLTKMLYSERTDISVKGNTTAHLGALHFNVKLDKTVNVAALRTLEGFSLTSANIKLPADEDGTNLVGEMMLPNWSDLDIGLGNLTFNAKAGDYLIGSASVFDVFLRPGNSTLPFKGKIFIDTVLDNILDIIGTQTQALTSGKLEVGISGNSTLVDGEHITYLENVLNPADIKSQIPITQLLSGILGSISNGDLTISGITDLLGDGIGSLLDNIFGNDNGGDSDDDGDDLITEIFGNGNSTDKGILGDLLDKLDMKNETAKNTFINVMLKAGAATR